MQKWIKIIYINGYLIEQNSDTLLISKGRSFRWSNRVLVETLTLSTHSCSSCGSGASLRSPLVAPVCRPWDLNQGGHTSPAVIHPKCKIVNLIPSNWARGRNTLDGMPVHHWPRSHTQFTQQWQFRATIWCNHMFLDYQRKSGAKGGKRIHKRQGARLHL